MLGARNYPIKPSSITVISAVPSLSNNRTDLNKVLCKLYFEKIYVNNLNQLEFMKQKSFTIKKILI